MTDGVESQHRNPNRCDRCGARREVIDDGLEACGWFCWARLRFGTDIGWETAVEKAIEYDVQPGQARKYRAHKQRETTQENSSP